MIPDRKLSISPSVIGVTFALLAPLLYSLLLGPIFLHPLTTPVIYALLGFTIYWALTFSLFAITRFVEHRPLTSLGIHHLSWRMTAVAVGLGILLSLTVPLLTLLASKVLPHSDVGGIIDTATNYPAWLILLSILTAGVTEEVLFRGYAIERLIQLTNHAWGSALISLIVFVLIHATGWNLSHLIGVVLPLGIILTGLYMWRRNLIFVIIVHILIDLPLFFISLGK